MDAFDGNSMEGAVEMRVHAPFASECSCKNLGDAFCWMMLFDDSKDCRKVHAA